MNNFDDIKKHNETRRLHISSNFIDNDLEKGKELPIGTERTHGGKQVVKTAKGWVPKKGDRKKSSKSIPNDSVIEDQILKPKDEKGFIKNLSNQILNDLQSGRRATIKGKVREDNPKHVYDEFSGINEGILSLHEVTKSHYSGVRKYGGLEVKEKTRQEVVKAEKDNDVFGGKTDYYYAGLVKKAIRLLEKEGKVVKKTFEEIEGDVVKAGLFNRFAKTFYVSSKDQPDLKKAISIMDDYLEKGGKRATIGEIRTFGGRDYIKTTAGWKFHGKGTGTKAQAHKESATKVKKESGVNKVESQKVQQVKSLLDKNEVIFKQIEKLDSDAQLQRSRGNMIKYHSIATKIDTLYDRSSTISDKIQELGKKMTLDEREVVLDYYGIGDLFDSITEEEEASTPSSGKKEEGKSDFKVTRKFPQKEEVLDKKEAAKKYSIRIKDLRDVEGLKRLKQRVENISINDRLTLLENLRNAVKKDRHKSESYQQLPGDHLSILTSLSILSDDYVGTIETKLGGKDFKVTSDGKMYVGDSLLEVDDSSGYIKLGGGGRSSSHGALYSGDYFSGQLQGIVYTHAAYKLRKLIVNQESDIDEKMSEGQTAVHGRSASSVWNHIKNHLKLK